jgi:hypothetical protein
MLRMISLKAGRIAIKRRFHRHVPMELAVAPLPSESPLYWRLLDGDSALVEVGIDRNNGSFLSLTLVSFLGKVELVDDQPKSEGHSLGVPLFDLSLWPRRHENRARFNYRDFRGPCRLELAPTFIRLNLLPATVQSWLWLESRLALGFSESADLCCAEVLDLTNRELLAFQEGLP